MADSKAGKKSKDDKKNSKNVSLFDGISFDKEGNEITVFDVLKTENPDYAEELHKKDNIRLLRKYLRILTAREKEILSKGLYLDRKTKKAQALGLISIF